MFSLLYFRQLKGFFVASLITLLRSKSALFFGIVFPIVFIVIFGLTSSNQQPKINIGIVDNQNSETVLIYDSLAKTDLFNIYSDSLENFQTKMQKKDSNSPDISAVIKVEIKKATSGSSTPNPVEIQIFSSPSKSADIPVINQALNNAASQSTLQKSKIVPMYSIVQAEITGQESFRYIDFALPGLLGFSLLSTGINGTAFSFLALRKNNVLKRLLATPIFKSAFLVGSALSRILFSIVQNILLIIVAIAFFNYHMAQGWLGFIQLLFLIFLAITAFMGMGYFVAGLSKKDDQASLLSQFFFLPQILLSGTFFPISSLPSWLENIVKYLPLANFNTAARLITIDGYNLLQFEVMTQVLVLCAWIIGIYAITSRVFKFS